MTTRKSKNQEETTAKSSKFVSRVLAQLNKTEAQKQKEEVKLFVKRTVIEIQQQISVRKGVISNLQLDLDLAQNNLDLVNQDFESARFTVSNNLESYLNNRNVKQLKVNECEDKIDDIQIQIANVQLEIQELESILSDFQ